MRAVKNFIVLSLIMSLMACWKQRSTDCNASGNVLCSETRSVGTQGGRWSLKARRWAGGHSYEVWKQESANPPLIWSNVLDSRYLNDCFGDECSKTKLFLDRDRRPLSVRACGAEAEDLKLATAGLSSVGFRLPRLDDFKNAERDGIRKVLQGLDNRIFWSSQLSPSLYLDVASVFYGSSGKTGIAYRHWRYSAICVAEESAQ